MSKKTRKRGLRHQDRAKAAQRNGGQKQLSLAQAGKTRKATGFPKIIEEIPGGSSSQEIDGSGHRVTTNRR